MTQTSASAHTGIFKVEKLHFQVKCPHCGDGPLLRLHRRWFERPLALFSRKRVYRCLECQRRFWMRLD